MDEHKGNGTSKGLVLFVTTMAVFVPPITVTAVNIALPTIGKDLSLDAVTLGWVATTYLLSAATLLVPFGRIADIYGRKRIFTYGIVIFTLASFCLGMTNSATMLIAFRAVQGVGGAMFFGTAIALLTTVFPSTRGGKPWG